MHVIEQDLAYILYTSGSTGTPKGIMHTHRSALSFAEWACEVYGLTAEDRVTNHAPYHFDLSTFDLFATLLWSGGTTDYHPGICHQIPRPAIPSCCRTKKLRFLTRCPLP